ncbi:hypothetical protein [Nitratireductor thuwali]|uniref:Secreted protein n=1 Tax=Nitratireductor thuwali TaxID=2267699 RepID=A0ABY5MHJ7_9HYPH|nr:hypothetical protein NTH_01947 [Nitratireductor thuwali]
MFSRHPFHMACALAAMALAIVVAAPAFAGNTAGEHVYEDEYGNLVIHHRAGFKSIVVGKGYLAEEIAPDAPGKPRIVYGVPRETKVVHLEDKGTLYLRPKRSDCRYGALLHGRSYMYGLPANVVPVPVVTCR